LQIVDPAQRIETEKNVRRGKRKKRKGREKKKIY
jgi:hypothetical protein